VRTAVVLSVVAVVVASASSTPVSAGRAKRPFETSSPRQVEASIRTTGALSIDDLRAWAADGNEITQGRIGPFDFPDIYDASGKPLGTHFLETGPGTGVLTYSSGFEYQTQPHLSLVYYNAGVSFLTLVVFHGVVKKRVADGDVYVAFGTQIFPGGAQETLAWIVNVRGDVFDDEPYSTLFSRRGVIVEGRVKNSVNRADREFKVSPRGEFLARLATLVGKPTVVAVHVTDGYGPGPGSLASVLGLDESTDFRVPGVSYYPDDAREIFSRTWDAWFRNDAPAFRAGLEEAVGSGLAVEPGADTGGRAVRKIFDQFDTVRGAFERLPFGVVYPVAGATSPL
jgi:hypothetical protein